MLILSPYVQACMKPLSESKNRITVFRRQEKRNALLLLVLSGAIILLVVSIWFLWRRNLSAGLAIGAASVAVVGLWKAVQALKRLSQNPLDPKLLELNPELVCQQEVAVLEDRLVLLRKSRQMELFLIGLGILTSMIAVVITDGFLAGVGIGISISAAILLVFTLFHLWRIDLFILESSD
jgi:hypothetical protein